MWCRWVSLGRFFLRLVVRFDPFGVKHAWSIYPLVSMRAEEIALGLEQIGRQTRGTVTVEVSERCRKCRDGDAILDCRRHCDAPIVLRVLDDVGKIGIEQEIVQRVVASVS